MSSLELSTKMELKNPPPDCRHPQHLTVAPSGKAGYLWLGHWRTGLDVWQYDAEGTITRRWHIHEPQVGNYIQSLQPLKGGAMAVGCYGKGVEIITLPGQSRDAWRDVAKTATQFAAAPEPQGARPPSESALDAMAAAIRKELLESKGRKQPRIVPLPDDWRTEGNWLGRYGKYWMCLFGARESVGDAVWGNGPQRIRHAECIGPHATGGDSVRFWIQTLFCRGPNALEIPPAYFQREAAWHPRAASAGRRRISEVDDHGEAYATWWQGPDINVLLTIPKGLFTLGFYEWNYNGHVTTMRLRDYAVSVSKFPLGWRYTNIWKQGALTAICYSKRSGVVARVEQNWGGEWVRFMVRGPVVVAVRFRRNYSFNTHVLGAALDYFNEHPAPYYFGRKAWRQRVKEERQTRRGLMARLAAEPWVYTAVLRAAGPDPKLARLAAQMESRAQYRLALFARWRETERSLGARTPIGIEAAVRWDGWRRSHRGIEGPIVRRLAAGRRPAAPPIGAGGPRRRGAVAN
jgi:hypothetical protein